MHHRLQPEVRALRAASTPIQVCLTCRLLHQAGSAELVSVKAWFEIWKIECRFCCTPLSSPRGPRLRQCIPAREMPHWFAQIRAPGSPTSSPASPTIPPHDWTSCSHGTGKAPCLKSPWQPDRWRGLGRMLTLDPKQIRDLLACRWVANGHIRSCRSPAVCQLQLGCPSKHSGYWLRRRPCPKNTFQNLIFSLVRQMIEQAREVKA